MYKCKVDTEAEELTVVTEKTLDDVTRQGEIEGISFDKEKKQITLNLEIDEKICTMYEYFDIFLGRMMMCRKASELLGVTFGLMVNGNKAL